MTYFIFLSFDQLSEEEQEGQEGPGGGITLRDSERTKQDEQSGKVCLSESKRKNMNLWPAFVLLTGRKMQSDSHVGSLG